MKEIPLSRRKVALVDDADFEWLNQWKWCAAVSSAGYPYAVRGSPRIYMHKLILNIGKEVKGDHKDGNTLNNRRYNLRPASTSQNGMNRRKQKNFSGFKGVWFSSYKIAKPWYARIKCKGKIINLGNYATAKEAAVIRDMAAIKYHKDFARLNFP